ncbi:MAG: hypothetical protein AB1589_24485, partial [Cyanobacteriota bacterium]
VLVSFSSALERAGVLGGWGAGGLGSWGEKTLDERELSMGVWYHFTTAKKGVSQKQATIPPATLSLIQGMPQALRSNSYCQFEKVK